MSWSEEQVECLKDLAERGFTASEIAARLGCGISRCAVLGKMHRLKESLGRDITSRAARVARDERISARRIITGSGNLAKARERDRLKKKRKRERIKMEGARPLKPGTSKTSVIYRNNLPRAPEMTKNELRALIAEAMRNTAALVPVTEAAE